MIIISDIHGCFYTLKRLLKKIPQGEPIVFAGDLVDRGPHSAQVIQFAIDNKIPSVLGNHEDLMMCDLGLNTNYQRGTWMMNGGLHTLDSYEAGKVSREHIEWLCHLPFFLKFDDLLVSHTGHGLVHDYDQMSALWAREHMFPDDGLYRVFGHTPEKNPIITDKFAMIDTGAAYRHHGYGVLTAFHWPSKQIYQQAYDESPC